MQTSRRTRRTAAVAAAVTTAALLSVGTTATATTGAPTAAPPATSQAATAVAGASATSEGATAVAAAMRGKKIKFKGTNSFATGSKIKIKGKAPTRRAKRVVILTEKKGRKWVRKGKKRTNRKGAFTFKVKAGSKTKNRTFKVTAQPVRGFRRTAKTRKFKVRHATGVTIGLSTPTPALGTGTTIGGAVTGSRPGGRSVTVQLRYADGWSDVASGTSNPDGGYAVGLPASWLFATETRVRVSSGGGAMAAFSPATPVQVTPTWAPPGNPGAWSHLGAASGQKFRWNPCEGPITYRINTARAPLDQAVAEQLIHEAIGQVSQGTGLTFQYLGRSNGVYQPSPGVPGHDADTKMLIGWALDAETTMQFKRPGGWTVGWGGGSGQGARDASGSLFKFVRGGVVLDAEYPVTPARATELLMHEIAHAVGLGHADGHPDQIMFPSLNDGPNVWGAGDITGLRDKGRQSGCIRPLANRGSAPLVDAHLP